MHSGFDDAFNVIERDVINALEQFPNLPLFITGHSLGGALATIAAKRLTHKGGNAACYTFGSPRVADDHWLMTMKTPICRVVNASDSVTMVPPSRCCDHKFVVDSGVHPRRGKFSEARPAREVREISAWWRYAISDKYFAGRL